MAQIAGGALAAATAAALGAQLGVAGTVIGAAFFSLIVNVGGKVYGETLRRTHHGLSGVMSRQGRTAPQSAEKTTAHAETTAAHAAVEREDEATEQGAAPEPRPVGGSPRRRRIKVSTIAVSALASFLIAAVAVTIFETATGRGLDGAPATTVSRIGQSDPAPKKPGGDEPKIAPTAPAEGGQQPTDGAETQAPPAQPSEPAVPDETRPDQAPGVPDTGGQDTGGQDTGGQGEPGSVPNTKADPPASQPSG